MIGRSLRDDAVAQIENERSTTQRIENVMDLPPHFVTAGNQQQRIEIALKTTRTLQPIPCPDWRHRRVEAQAVDSGRPKIGLRHRTGATRKADHRYSREPLPQGRANFGHRRRRKASEGKFRQTSGPGIENLHHLCARLDLGREMFDRRRDKKVDQFLKLIRRRIGQAFAAA